MPMVSVKVDVTGPGGGLDAIAKLEREGRMSDLIHLNEPFEIGGVPHGMASGRASVGMAFTLPDGKVLLVETSLASLKMAMAAFNGRYPDE